MGGRQFVWRSLNQSVSSSAITEALQNAFSTNLMAVSDPVLEGVFAINKPPAISSAQVIRDVQEHFNPSRLFQPWLQRELMKRGTESHNQKQKRNKWKARRASSVKIGHGGTLDPMATGVLILGIGSGTKKLHHFMTECTKSYEATVLFGTATDTYDTEGKIVGRKPHEHITREMVEEALSRFRGKGLQKPPIFSALRMQGKRLYEYAREGIELPEEIKERPVEVHKLEMLEWHDGGTHEFHWPEREAETAEKQFAGKMLKLEDDTQVTAETTDGTIEVNTKRKRDDQNGVDEANHTAQEIKRQKADDLTGPPSAPPISQPNLQPPEDVSKAAKADNNQLPANLTSEDNPAPSRTPCSAPACKIRMTVTSGFYVRSLCHDLGAAVGSLAIMASLVRTRQGAFELGTNVLWYDNLKEGEDVWGPKVKQLLEEWGDGEGKRSEMKTDGETQVEDGLEGADKAASDKVETVS